MVLISCSSKIDGLQDHAMVKGWIEQNPRISKEFEILSKNKTLQVILQENSKVGSPVIEDISSANLAYTILNTGSDINTYDTITISFKLPANFATYGVDKKQVLQNDYSFDRSRFAILSELFSIKSFKECSDYITFNMKNEDEHDLLKTGNLAKDVFRWFGKYGFENQNGLEMIYSYPLTKNNTNIKEEIITYHQTSLSALRLIGIEAKIKSLHHIDSLFQILEDIPVDLSLVEIDSIGNNLVLQ